MLVAKQAKPSQLSPLPAVGRALPLAMRSDRMSARKRDAVRGSGVTSAESAHREHTHSEARSPWALHVGLGCELS